VIAAWFAQLSVLPRAERTDVRTYFDRSCALRVSLSQDNNSSKEAAEHSQANWEKMLAGLKQVVEGS
jgi:hypothetical protein